MELRFWLSQASLDAKLSLLSRPEQRRNLNLHTPYAHHVGELRSSRCSIRSRSTAEELDDNKREYPYGVLVELKEGQTANPPHTDTQKCST